MKQSEQPNPSTTRSLSALHMPLGSGCAENKQHIKDLCLKAFAASPQVLVEKSMKGRKEIGYEGGVDCLLHTARQTDVFEWSEIQR